MSNYIIFSQRSTVNRISLNTDSLVFVHFYFTFSQDPTFLNQTLIKHDPNIFDTEGLLTHIDFLFPSGVELNKPTHFTVSTKGAGKANLDCNFSGPTKAEAVKDFEIINNHDNTHTVKYTPVQQVRWEKHLHR